MAFDGYTIFRDNVFDSSFHMVFETHDGDETRDIVESIIKANKTGDVIAIFEDDTEYNGTLIYSAFNDGSGGWTQDYGKTDIELTILETNGFFDC